MSRAVQDSKDVRRVESLPRRTWSKVEAQSLAEQMTAALRTPHGSQTLRPVQAVALYELATRPGALLPIRVGGGKTLISALAATVSSARRPLLLIPAHLREKTEREFEKLRADWSTPPFIRIESYQQLSTAGSATMLEDYRPDLIVADECHYLKNQRAACTRRVSRYMNEHGARVRFVAMSGTITKRSLRDFSHLALWALHEGSPCPVNWKAIEEWSLALDAQVPDHRRLELGALARLGPFRDRLIQTPGVVATQEGPLPIRLTITGECFEAPPVCEQALGVLRSTWETPDGHPIADGIAAWRHAQELALGFYGRWNPRPPESWLAPRRAWSSLCRELLKNNRRQLDTERQMVMAIDAGHYPEAASTLQAWREVRDTFEIRTEAVWLSDHAVEYVSRWLQEHGGIAWTTHRHFRERFGELNYGAQGLNCNGRQIEDHPHGSGMIASVRANSSGRNLQYGWSKNLIVSADNTDWEQMLGRTHRPGQRAQEVSAHVLFGCVEALNGFWKAVNLAGYAETVTGQAQKLSHADLDVPEDPPNLFSPQWAKGA